MIREIEMSDIITNTCVKNIKEGITGRAASWYSDVFDVVFPNLDAEEINNRWKAQLKTGEKEKKDLIDPEEE